MVEDAVEGTAAGPCPPRARQEGHPRGLTVSHGATQNALDLAAAGPPGAATSFASRGSRPTHSHAEVAQPYGSVKSPQRLSRSGSIRAELIVAMGVALEVVLVFGLGLPEGTGLADLGRDLGTPKARGVGDRFLGDLALLVAGVEDFGAVVEADQLFDKVGPVDLEEEFQDVPVGGPPGIEDDLDRLGVTRMVAGGRVVILAAGVPDPG